MYTYITYKHFLHNYRWLPIQQLRMYSCLFWLTCLWPFVRTHCIWSWQQVCLHLLSYLFTFCYNNIFVYFFCSRYILICFYVARGYCSQCHCIWSFFHDHRFFVIVNYILFINDSILFTFLIICLPLFCCSSYDESRTWNELSHCPYHLACNQ